MKLGCIFKTLALVVVVLGISFFLYEKYGADFIAVGKEKAKQVAIEKIESILVEYSGDKLSENMKEKITAIADDLEKRRDEFSDEQWSELIGKVQKIVKENKIDEETINDIKKIIEPKAK